MYNTRIYLSLDVSISSGPVETGDWVSLDAAVEDQFLWGVRLAEYHNSIWSPQRTVTRQTNSWLLQV